MDENVNHVSVAEFGEAGQVEGQLSIGERQKLAEHYSSLLGMMYTIAAQGMADEAGLVFLQKKTTHLIEMLSLFNRSWANEITVIQKAVFQYLATEGIAKKERQRIIDVWGDWSTFLIDISRYRGLLTQHLQYYQRQVSDLDKLLKQDNSL